MKIINWDDVIKGKVLYPNGTAVSIGGFDGPHRGHTLILSAVLKAARQAGIQAGIITFFRSPRSVKAAGAYTGDVSTLEMRLQKFTEAGFDFIILIDFSADFAKMSGIIFFDILIKTICIKYLAVGSDFTCGYRHDTGVQDLTLLARERGFCFDSIEQLYSDQHERISSSAIRKAVQRADFSHAKALLGYPFFLDVAHIVQQCENTVLFIEKASITQILPQNGQYEACAYLRTGMIVAVRVKITDTLLEVFEDTAVFVPFTAERSICRLEFIRKE